MPKFQPIVNTDLSEQEFQQMKILATMIQERTITSFVGDLIRNEINKHQILIASYETVAQGLTKPVGNNLLKPKTAPTLPFQGFAGSDE